MTWKASKITLFPWLRKFPGNILYKRQYTTKINDGNLGDAHGTLHKANLEIYSQMLEQHRALCESLCEKKIASDKYGGAFEKQGTNKQTENTNAKGGLL